MKILTTQIYSCEVCPFCRYDGYYDRSRDSGYDCKHPDTPLGRIVDDWDVNNSNNPNPSGWPTIPSNCPLPDYVEPTEPKEPKDPISAIKL